MFSALPLIADIAPRSRHVDSCPNFRRGTDRPSDLPQGAGPFRPNLRRDLALSLFSRGSYFQPSIPMIAFHSRRLSCLETQQNGIARMRIIALLFAFVLAGCTGNRLNADTKPIAVALCAPPMAGAVMTATTI